MADEQTTQEQQQPTPAPAQAGAPQFSGEFLADLEPGEGAALQNLRNQQQRVVFQIGQQTIQLLRTVTHHETIEERMEGVLNEIKGRHNIGDNQPWRIVDNKIFLVHQG